LHWAIDSARISDGQGCALHNRFFNDEWNVWPSFRSHRPWPFDNPLVTSIREIRQISFNANV
jgi:hypothetical protein